MKRGLVPFIVLFFVFGCVSSKQVKVQDKPPGFFGKLFDNTVSRYNAFYNSSLIYDTSISSASKGYRENYDELFATSVEDEVASSGNAGGNMDEIIEKTAKMIEKKPYSKWVDDHFLLNGIAHYIKGDYVMAERIFRFVGSEYQDGIQFDRVESRQKVRSVELAKQRRDAAKEKLKETEKKREEIEKKAEEEKQEREKEIKASNKDRSKRAKSRKKRAKQLKKKNERLKREAEEEAKNRKKQGKEVDALEIVREIKKQEREIEASREKITDKDRELLAKAPTLQQEPSKQKDGLLAHELAAKDALLWLAKTYITTEQYIAANAVLTAINEDVNFPTRLNTDYYLTYADMHIQLDNKPKAIEYIILAAESARRQDKGRLYYLLGQLYVDTDQWDKAEEAFNTVEKYHPYYDMIYHAKMNNIEHSFEIGQFAEQDFVTPLKKMSKDAKNDDFLDEVFYFLGRAYEAQGDKENATKAYERSIESEGGNKEVKKNVHLALATQYYNEKDFVKAQPNYEEALNSISEETSEKEVIQVYSEKLKVINDNIEIIRIQDSLLHLASLTPEEQLKLTEKKVKKEIRAMFRKKLQEENQSFGNDVNSGNTRRDRRQRNRQDDDSNGFYFYDMQQSVTGYSEFKQQWGDRPNVDNWRLSKNGVRSNRSARRTPSTDGDENVEIKPEAEQIADYIAQIPNSREQKEISNQTIYESYLKLIEVFGASFGDTELAGFYADELKKRNPPSNFIAQIIESEEEVVSSNTPSANTTEIETLYNQVYDSYVDEKYEKVLQLIPQAEQFQNNQFIDKFAYIQAMSKGKLEGSEAMITELKNFVKKYPNSPLKAKAQKLIK